MHRLYEKMMASIHPGDPIATCRQYKDTFDGEFNLSFFTSRKDQCNVCTLFSGVEEESEILAELLKNRTCGRDLKESDKTKAINEGNGLTVACFDFQKVLSTPQSKASLIYYKRKLSVFNMTIYNMAPKIGYCCVWDETQAKKGSNEVSSALKKFLDLKIAEGMTDFIFNSDNCGGPNRNRYVFGFYARYAKIKNINITHRFLETGHTQMEVDSVHALIERAKERHRYIFLVNGML